MKYWQYEKKPFSDDSISKKEYHSYSPYQQSFKPNDEIRITIQNQDLYVHLSLALRRGSVPKKYDAN